MIITGIFLTNDLLLNWNEGFIGLILTALSITYFLVAKNNEDTIYNSFLFSGLITFSIGAGSVLLYLDLPIENVEKYFIVVLGLIYILFSFYNTIKIHRYLKDFLYLVGSMFIYISILFLTFENYSILWEIFAYIVIFCGFMSSSYIKSKIFLTVNILALVGYILYTTSEHFIYYIGWSFALFILAFIFIGIGYYSIKLFSLIKK